MSHGLLLAKRELQKKYLSLHRREEGEAAARKMAKGPEKNMWNPIKGGRARAERENSNCSWTPGSFWITLFKASKCLTGQKKSTYFLLYLSNFHNMMFAQITEMGSQQPLLREQFFSFQLDEWKQLGLGKVLQNIGYTLGTWISLAYCKIVGELKRNNDVTN